MSWLMAAGTRSTAAGIVCARTIPRTTTSTEPGSMIFAAVLVVASAEMWSIRVVWPERLEQPSAPQAHLRVV